MTTFQPGDVSAFTAAFASVARALADAADPPLSPQAVLDAILDSACPASDPDPKDWCAYVIESHCAEHTLTAREVDGHWQVKSVGSSS